MSAESKKESPIACFQNDVVFTTQSPPYSHNHTICKVDFSESAKNGYITCLNRYPPDNALLNIVLSRNIVLLRRYFERATPLGPKIVNSAIRACIINEQPRFFLAIASHCKSSTIDFINVVEKLPCPQNVDLFLSVLCTVSSMLPLEQATDIREIVPNWVADFLFFRFAEDEKHAIRDSKVFVLPEVSLNIHIAETYITNNNREFFFNFMKHSKFENNEECLDMLIANKRYSWIPNFLKHSFYEISPKTLVKKMSVVNDIPITTMVTIIAHVFKKRSFKNLCKHITTFSDTFCIAARIFRRNLLKTNHNINNNLYLLGVETSYSIFPILNNIYGPDLSNMILEF